MYKIIHIHTDEKFLRGTKGYFDSFIHNEIVFIGETDETIISKLQDVGLVYHVFSEIEVAEIVAKTASFDGVVLHGLDPIKTSILQKLHPSQKVFLRLFGYELYNMKKDKFLSKKTLELAYPINLKKHNFKDYLKRKTKRILGVEYPVNKKEQKDLYSKIDSVILLNKFEYEELNKYFYLPKFIQLPLVRKVPHTSVLSNKINSIIVGNSGHVWNNHIDIFRIIKKSKRIEDFNFVLFFSYGQNNKYAKVIRKEANINDFVLIENFLNPTEFNEIYDNAAALIINSYRQHAFGNIHTAILSGVKVYLNKRSSTYKWLVSEGFCVYEISLLKNDLKTNNIYLKASEHEHNLSMYENLKKSNTSTDFINNIKKVLDE